MKRRKIHSSKRRGAAGGLFMLAVWFTVSPVFAVTRDDLLRSPKLTPQSFAKHFANFKFERHGTVQSPEVFLATQTGDCDDYATLAADILRQKGFATHLISIRMPGDIHVVCYVEQTKTYLDYNNRRFLVRTVGSDGSLRDIATKVAKSFGARWASVAEFTYTDGVKRLKSTLTQEAPAMLAASR